MKTILVLTDFSERAEVAAEYALNLCLKNKANLVLCHVSEVTAHIADGLEFAWPMADYLQLKNESIEALKSLTNRLTLLIPNEGGADAFKPSINHVTDFGLLPDVAALAIAEKSADLVVIGQHSTGSFGRLLFGSHTYAVLDKIKRPVLLVPETAQFNDVKNIAYATDRTFNDQKVIDYLVEIAKPFAAKITVDHISLPGLTVAESEQAVEYLLNEQLEEGHPSVFYHTIKASNVQASLMALMNSGNIDMLALVHKRYDFFEGLFHTSISKRMADHAKVPLLILPYSYSLDVAEINDRQLDNYCFNGGESR